MTQQTNGIYEFGSFRLDAQERLLQRDGATISLTPKAFDLLLAMVEHHGRLLEKDELMKLVWPGTFVEEANLSYNISLIRKALGDGENGQKFIETVPKRGYRFVAGVQEVSAEQAKTDEAAAHNNEAGAQTEYLADKVNRRRKAALLALAVSVIAIGVTAFGLYKFIIRSESKSSGPEPKTIPVTSFPGNESQPAFSPDGAQIAFVWDGEQENNQDIYVKLIDAGEPLRLTTNPAPDLNPVWSPDGRYIAFTRESQESGVYLVPTLGGAERKLAEVFPERPFNKLSLSYSPDGKFLAVADKAALAEPYSIFLLSTETDEKRRLTSPPAGLEGDDNPVFSPDGRSLAFTRSLGIGSKDIYVAPVAGGGPKRLTSDDANINGLAWTPDGREIVFSSRRGGSIQYLWRVAVAGGAPERLDVFAQELLHPVVSRQGNRLAWTQGTHDPNIWQVEIASDTRQAAAPVKLIASSLYDGAPQYSPDGQKIAFGSSRTGSAEIWVSDRNGANLIQVTNLGEISGTPRWSSDGRQIAFDSLQEGNRDIYVVSANGGRPRRLTTEPGEDMCPSWSLDGRWIYFCSSRGGSLQIWKASVEGGQAMQVTRQGGFEGFESPGGKYFYYAKGRRVAGIWRIPVEGGEETLVLDHHRAGYWRCWAVTEQGIYFATAETPSRPQIEFFSFATGKVTHVATIEKQIQAGTWGLAVSPDSRWILYTQLDQRGSDIMLMENFR
jgi:Tol biopolymer transport system component/DNA-binding winged helix-turn-helix (wHTH) protein